MADRNQVTQSAEKHTPVMSAEQNQTTLKSKKQQIKQSSSKKCITSQGMSCFLLQMLNFYEIACIFMTIHAFKINELKVELGLIISFFLLSKILKIGFLIKKKQYLKIVLVIFCLDYLIIYLIAREERNKNEQLVEGDKLARKQWIQAKDFQQKKIDVYVESLQPKPEESQQDEEIPRGNKRRQTQSKQRQYNKSQLPTQNDFGVGSFQFHSPQKQTLSTRGNTTEPNIKEIFQYEETDRKNINQANTDIQFKSLITEQEFITNNHLSTKNEIPQISQETDRKEGKQVLKRRQTFQKDSPSKKKSNPENKKIERTLQKSITSSAFKKFKLTQEQIDQLVNNQFITVYLESDLNVEDEKYFIRRKLIVNSMRIIDGITLSAPCLYIISESIVNNSDTLDMVLLLYISYWSLVVCLAISITLLLNIQLLPYRQHNDFFWIQIRSFIKNLAIVISTIVCTSILWGVCSKSWITLLVYDASFAVVVFHQVYSLLLSKVYEDQINSDRHFKYILFLLCCLFSIIVCFLLLFANVILVLNTDFIHEALLQFRQMLEQPDCKIKKDDLHLIEKKQKIAARFLIRQNLFFLLNIIGLFIISFFVNNLYSQSWDSEVLVFHKILIGFFPICLLGVLSLVQDYKFFSDTLHKILYIHFNRMLEKLNRLRVQLKQQQEKLQSVELENQVLEKQFFNIQNLLSENNKKAKSIQEDEIKLNKTINQFSAFGQSYNSEIQQMKEFNKLMQDIHNQSTDLKAQFLQIQPLFLTKNEEFKEKQKEYSELENELHQMEKDNGFD